MSEAYPARGALATEPHADRSHDPVQSFKRAMGLRRARRYMSRLPGAADGPRAFRS